MTEHNIEVLARRRLALLAQREEIDQALAEVDARLLAACPVGERIEVDGPEPDPEPEWREWVTAQHDEVVGSRASALEDVLMCLSEVERGTSKSYALARIVARCEREVGDGWQADPSGWVATPALHALLRCVAGVPTGPGTAWPETDWQGLANAASAWLRDLTDGAE